jgi:predicted permease
MIVLPQLIMLFSIAAIGAFLRKKNALSDAAIKGISGIVTLVTNPALLITVTQYEYTPETLRNFLHVLWICTVLMSLVMLVVYAAFRRQSDRVRPLIAMLSVMPNAAFMGLPIILAVYGELGALYLAANVVAFNLVIWTLGIGMTTGRFNLRGLINPGFIAAVVGMVIFFLRIKLPEAASATLTSLGAVNTPLAMMVLGARLIDVKPRSLIDPRSAAASAIKLVVMPLLTLVMARAFSLSGAAAGAMVLSSAMPSAVIIQMIAEKYDKDAAFAAQALSVCSMASAFTIPLIVSLLTG